MKKQLLVIFVLMITASANATSANDKSMGVDQARVEHWNHFSEQLARLHQSLTTISSIRKESKQGGYQGEFFNKKDFFVEETFYNKRTNQLVSRIKWEKENPDNIHVLEVYIYDSNGRVKRDYLVAYLPWSRNAPIQALVNLHSYNNDLHSFRQFDASGERIYEQCNGSLGGKLVTISLESHEIESPRIDQRDYRQCFSTAPLSAGKYLNPH